MALRVDLNGDVGETASGAVGPDLALIPHITSANVACGFHAGDPGVMRATVEFAREHGVAVGAHPGFPDPEGFGRRELHFSPADVEDFVAYQVGALAAIAAGLGVRLQHVKPHGALFNMAVRDASLADAIARGAALIDRTLILFGLPDSEIVLAGNRAGLRTAGEGFADCAAAMDDPSGAVPVGARMSFSAPLRTASKASGFVITPSASRSSRWKNAWAGSSSRVIFPSPFLSSWSNRCSTACWAMARRTLMYPHEMTRMAETTETYGRIRIRLTL